MLTLKNTKTKKIFNLKEIFFLIFDLKEKFN